MEPRYILVHSHKATLDANALDPRAHCFGPFDSWDDLVAFDAAMPTDSCYRFAFPLAGPKTKDIDVASVGAALGLRPAARMLPPREAEGLPPYRSPIASVIQEAIAYSEKAAKKAAKRERKIAKRLERERDPEA